MDGSLPMLGLGTESTWDDIREEVQQEMSARDVEIIDEITHPTTTTTDATSIETLSKVRTALDEIIEKTPTQQQQQQQTQAQQSSEQTTTFQKAKSAILMLARIFNALPMFSYEVAKRAGVSERTARAALVFATVGDYFVPVVFSAAVVVTATIIRPAAPVDVTLDLIRGIRSRVSDIARITGSVPPPPPPSVVPPQPQQSPTPPWPAVEDWH